jgi:hypothetical protein
MNRVARVSVSSFPALVALLSPTWALAVEPPPSAILEAPTAAPPPPTAKAAPSATVAEPATDVTSPSSVGGLPALAVVPSLPVAPPEPAADRSVSSPGPRRHMWGMAMDVGVPDGAGLGLSVRPVDWLRVGAAVTHNTMAPGARVGVTLDPMRTPVGITLTVEGGHYWSGAVPGIQGAPAVAYNYANFHAGLEFGDRSSFRFFLHGGASWLDMSASASQSGLSGLSNLSYRGWIAPSAKLGFSLYF